MTLIIYKYIYICFCIYVCVYTCTYIINNVVLLYFSKPKFLKFKPRKISAKYGKVLYTTYIDTHIHIHIYIRGLCKCVWLCEEISSAFKFIQLLAQKRHIWREMFAHSQIRIYIWYSSENLRKEKKFYYKIHLYM